jgi:propanediol dehydratase small subunit
MSNSTLLVLLISLAILLSGFIWPLPRVFRKRSCQGKEWRRAFPDSSKENIRLFLSVFVDAFAFNESHRLKFNPDDKILTIYKTLYPSTFLADSLELETLAESVDKQYGISFSELWSDQLTIGELFAATQQRLTTQSRGPPWIY